MIGADDVAHALALQPIAQLDGADHFGVVPTGEVNGVADVVVMGVGEEDGIEREVLDLGIADRVVLDEGVDDDGIARAVREHEGGVAEPGHRRHGGLLQYQGQMRLHRRSQFIA